MTPVLIRRQRSEGPGEIWDESLICGTLRLGSRVELEGRRYRVEPPRESDAEFRLERGRWQSLAVRRLELVEPGLALVYWRTVRTYANGVPVTLYGACVGGAMATAVEPVWLFHRVENWGLPGRSYWLTHIPTGLRAADGLPLLAVDQVRRWPAEALAFGWHVGPARTREDIEALQADSWAPLVWRLVGELKNEN